MKRSPIRRKPKRLEVECRALFREAILLRDGRKCLRCATHGGEHRGLQVSHILPKGQFPGLRFEMENAIVLCLKHHLFWWHKNPIEAGKWIRDELGADRLERLRFLSRTRRLKPDLKVTKLWLEAQVEKLRRAG